MAEGTDGSDDCPEEMTLADESFPVALEYSHMAVSWFSLEASFDVWKTFVSLWRSTQWVPAFSATMECTDRDIQGETGRAILRLRTGESAQATE